MCSYSIIGESGIAAHLVVRIREYARALLCETLLPTLDIGCSTSGMAEDVIALLDYIGWTEKRGVHVVGCSLGGMIAMGKSHPASLPMS